MALEKPAPVFLGLLHQNIRLKNTSFWRGLNNESVMCLNSYARLDEETRQLRFPHWNTDVQLQYITGKQLAVMNQIGNFSAFFFRKSAIRNMNQQIFNVKFADWLFALELSRQGRIIKSKEVMSVYRVHSKGQWSRLSHSERNDMMIALSNKYNIFLDYKYDNEFKRLRRYHTMIEYGVPHNISYYIASILYHLKDRMVNFSKVDLNK